MATLSSHAQKHRVTVVGSGNWGSAIAKIVAENTQAHPDVFEPEVQMWVFEEQVTVPETSSNYNAASPFSTEKHNLTEIINTVHENVKYLPNITLPSNIKANPDLRASVKEATIIIFNMPHQFINKICEDMKGHILPYARAISCIKGVNVSDEEISLFSDSIGQKLGIYCGALSGANIANEVALEKFSETTIGYDPPSMDSRNPTPKQTTPSTSSTHLPLQLVPSISTNTDSPTPSSQPLVHLTAQPTTLPPLDQQLLKSLFHRPYFHVRVISDVAGVSLGGALKNIVALTAGFVSGLQWGDNAKAAVMRVGLLEMVKFGSLYFKNPDGTPGVCAATFTEESCGVADLITSCSGGRNYRCAKLATERKVAVEVIEREVLNGQMLQGIGTCREVNSFLRRRDAEKEFPLLTATYQVLQGHAKAEELPDLIE